jgi:hypothetical protein
MQYKMPTLATALVVGLMISATAAHVQAAPAGKPQAPVEIAATVQARKATLKVTFEAAAEQVNIRVYGVDGLTVVGTKSPVIGGTFAAGQVMTLSVGYTPGPGTSNLAVQVDGQFDGKHRSRISSFTVEDGRAAKRNSSTPSATISVDGQGRRIAVLPAESK